MNLLEETTEILKENGKHIFDIVWFGTKKYRYDCDLQTLLNIEYDDGYGGHEIPTDFILVGDNFWLERREYDGSEWWEYKEHPKRPSLVKGVNKLIT